jgi:4-aminobutyrate aminotransferase-like enzyme
LDASLIPVGEGETAALKVVKSLMAKGLITVPAGTETFRLLPPLNVIDEEVDEALAIVRDVLSEF